MRKHLRLIVLVTLLALALSPLSSFASGSCDMCGYEYDGSTCNTICGGAGVSSDSASSRPPAEPPSLSDYWDTAKAWLGPVADTVELWFKSVEYAYENGYGPPGLYMGDDWF